MLFCSQGGGSLQREPKERCEKVSIDESTSPIVTEKGVVRHELPRESVAYHKVPMRKGCCHKVDSKEIFCHVLHWEEAQ